MENRKMYRNPEFDMDLARRKHLLSNRIYSEIKSAKITLPTVEKITGVSDKVMARICMGLYRNVPECELQDTLKKLLLFRDREKRKRN